VPDCQSGVGRVRGATASLSGDGASHNVPEVRDATCLEPRLLLAGVCVVVTVVLVP
jgi:hypothetical protein